MGRVGVARARGIKIGGRGEERKVNEFPILFSNSVDIWNNALLQKVDIFGERKFAFF